MSRTYRSKSYGSYMGRREFEGKNTHWKNMGYSLLWYVETWEEHELSIYKDGAWTQSTPSWWVHDFMTIKERARTRMAIKKVYKLIDYEDYVEFPLDKKPYEYYW